MRRSHLRITVVILVLAACAGAQEPEADRVCTDLSGKVRLSCPNTAPQQPESKSPPDVRDEASPTGSVVPASARVGGLVQPPASPARKRESSTEAATDDLTLGGATAARSGPPAPSLERSLARNFVADQKNLLTSPLRLRPQDAMWLLPLATATTAVVLSDGSIERRLPTSVNVINRSKSFSNYGAAGYAGLVAGGYLWARATNNDHLRETAILSGEAAANSLLITEGIKYIAGRQRPLEGDGSGEFRRGGSSFPSLHAAGAWSIASVIAREYPGPLTQLLAYGGAAAISAARVTGRQHFASDALVGSAIGWFVGRQVYNAHHDRQDDAAFGTFERSVDRGPRDPAFMGSPYVPLDSWIYPALDRLAALGYIHAAFAGLRPWTRMECARLLEEANTNLLLASDTSMASRLYSALMLEFAPENRRWSGDSNRGAQVESVYVRYTGISGRPLNDSYHFGETLVNDYGRPYQQGSNSILGTSGSAQAGPLAVYVRGEFQHAPGAAAYPQAVQDLIQISDIKPKATALPIQSVDRFDILEAYASLAISDFQLSIGRQSLSWGPTSTGSFLMSANSQPVDMIRLSRSSPFTLPGPFKFLGLIRTEFFVGRLSGHHYVNLQYPAQLGYEVGSLRTELSNQPFINGQKFSFKPTPNLELGFAKTGVFGGPNFPVTLRSFGRSLFATTNTFGGGDPGDRRSSFDFSYRLPKLRNWVTLYNDSFTEDEVSPVGYPRRSAMNPGIYISHFPKLPNLDLRAEGGYTDLPGLIQLQNGGYFYWNTRYLDGYTNDGKVLGNWIGRQGRSLLFSSTYWISPRDRVEVEYRKSMVNRQFLEGGYIQDVTVRSEFRVANDVTVQPVLQVENWNFPLLSSGATHNVTAQFQIIYRPRFLTTH